MSNVASKSKHRNNKGVFTLLHFETATTMVMLDEQTTD